MNCITEEEISSFERWLKADRVSLTRGKPRWHQCLHFIPSLVSVNVNQNMYVSYILLPFLCRVRLSELSRSVAFSNEKEWIHLYPYLIFNFKCADHRGNDRSTSFRPNGHDTMIYFSIYWHLGHFLFSLYKSQSWHVSQYSTEDSYVAHSLRPGCRFF